MNIATENLSKLRFDRQYADHCRQGAPPQTGVWLIVKNAPGIVLPAYTPAAEHHLVAALGRGFLCEDRLHLTCERGMLEQNAHFRVDRRRARIEVERADEAVQTVDDEGLGVQARAARAKQRHI